MSTGLAFPEFMVRGLVAHTLDALFADPDLLTETLAGLPGPARDSIQTALATREGRVRLGWSAEPIEDWCITVTLAGTAKGNGGRGTIGDIASRPEEVLLAFRELAAPLGSREDTVATFTTPAPSVPDEVEARGLVRFRDGEILEYATYAIAAGVCTIARRGILSTRPMLWDDGTEVTFFEWEHRDGWPEEQTLRLDVGGTNPVFVMAIARIVQAYLVLAAGAGDFDAAGFTLQGCDATDLAPRPPIWPEPFFNRTLTVRFLSALSLPELHRGIVATPVELTTD